MRGLLAGVGGLILLAGVMLAHRYIDTEGTITQPGPPPVADPYAALEEGPAEFWRRVAQLQPRYGEAIHNCPVDNTELKVPIPAYDKDGRKQDNRFGGVATDLMKLAVAPQADNPIQPDFSKQDWRMLLATNPNNGATYQEIDLAHIRMGYVPGATRNLQDWDLALLAPRLSVLPQSEWTDDERALAHYLTKRQAGWEDYELAFAALIGAHAANFAASQGYPQRIPSAAFYALSATHMDAALQETAGFVNRSDQAAGWLLLAEARRLLGDFAKAEAAIGEARHVHQEIKTDLVAQMDRLVDNDPQLPSLERQISVKDQELAVVEQISALIAAEDASLMCAELPALPAPPVGWLLDGLLPPINEHLAANREAWADQLAAPEVVELIVAEYETE